MLNRTGSIWNRSERIKINDNWDKLDKIATDFDIHNIINRGLYVDSINLIDLSKVTDGVFILYSSGAETENPSFVSTEFIKVLPNRFYRFEPLNQFAWYDADKNYISGGSSSQSLNTPNPQVSPPNAAYFRGSIHKNYLSQAMFYESVEKREYEAFKEPIKLATNADINKLGKRLYNISQIYHEWKSGKKFPIAFLDDSQTDGTGTTGHSNNVIGTDHRPPNAYPTLLETEFKKLTGKTTLRIYNAGFSGKSASWAVSNFDSILGSYSDTKMMFIGYGTNDRLAYSTPAEFYTGFKTSIETLIEMCLSRQIQPVLMTEQPCLSPGVKTEYVNTYPLRNAGNINAVTNKVKYDLAREYNLEIVDVTKLLIKVVNGKTSIPMTTIFNGNDKLHFGDGGHKLVSQVFLSQIYPYTVTVDDYTVIDLFSQYIEDGVPEEKALFGRNGLFTAYADYAVTVDELMLKQAIYIDDYKEYKISVDTRTDSSAYLKLNGVKQSSNTVIVEPGYYLVEIMSGTTRAGFNGITIEKALE